MTPDPCTLIDGYFDDVLTDAQQAELSDWIKSDPEHARTFARAALLHDHLRSALSADQNLIDLHESKRARLVTRLPSGSMFSSALWRTAASIAVVLAGLTVLWLSSSPSTASAAFRELNRIIVSSSRSKDRTYEIVVEDIVTPMPRGKRSAENRQRPPKPPLDGATLHVREGQQFVLIRKTSEGVPFITGSNGRESWAVNTRGPVRVSSNIHQFDHDLPGHETSVPLTNLKEGLERLKRSYDLQLSTLGPEEYEGQGAGIVRLLLAVKKPRERGPQRVEIAYDAQSGNILHMRFVQMPYGPDRLDLRLSLLNEDPLPGDFFEHTSHHKPDYPVELEN